MNKFMVRLFAVVLSVMMLGTVAFAATAEVGSDAITSSNFDAGYTTTGVQTVMAYVADSANDTSYTAEDIIALDQAVGAAASIAIDTAASKVQNADYIIVLYGNANGTTDKAVINCTGLDEYDVIECATTLTLVDGPYTKVYTNVAVAKQTFAAPEAGKTVEKYGVKWIKNGIESNNETVGAAGTLVEGGGDVNFGVVMYNIPDGVVITAKPFVQYAE